MPPHASSAVQRLAAIYQRARLVPLLGAGMSATCCVTWKVFVENLEESAGTRDPAEGDAALVERSHRALTALRRRGANLGPTLVQALREGAKRDPAEGTPQTLALAQLRWPLVLTTNYDDLFVQATVAAKESGPLVLGRSPLDCQRVLASLHEPSEPLLWALHGYIGNVGRSRYATSRIDEEELVVGHDEYRRVTHTAVHFRRAFSEVLRSRSLLFLGCGLDDPHLTGLLEETLALTGASPMPHFAVVFEEDGSSARRWLLRTRLNVEPVVLPRFEDLPPFLSELRQAVIGPRPRVARWPLHISAAAGGGGSEAPVEIVRGPLPERPPSGACLAVSAGRAGQPGDVRPWFSDGIWSQLKRLGVRKGTPLPPVRTASAARVAGFPVIIAFARTTDFALFGRDARLIAQTTENVLDVAHAEGFGTVHAQLLAAGAGSPFPPRVALAFMLRGFARSVMRRGPGSPRLAIHVIGDELLQELDSQRLDLLEMLDPSSVRFWVEVSDDRGRADRELRHEALTMTLGELASAYFTSSPNWGATVYPGPIRQEELVNVTKSAARTIEELGVLPGATVRFQRKAPPRAARLVPSARNRRGSRAAR